MPAASSARQIVGVSVLMPMRNAVDFVAAAIDSILVEREVALELIVIDDGSTDGSRELVDAIDDPRVRVIDGPCTGISACLNRGLAAMIGTIAMRCDADDLYPSGRIRAQFDWLMSRPGFVAICGPFAMVSPEGREVSAPEIRPEPGSGDDVSSQILAGRLRTHLCTFAFRRDAVSRIGDFRAFFETAEDIDFQLRLASCGPVGFRSANAYLYRLHDASITHRQPSALRLFFEATAYRMARDRLQTGSDALMRGEPVELPSVGGAAARRDDAGLHMAQLLVGEAWREWRDGRRGAAVRAAWRAVQARPGYFDAWKSLVLVGLKVVR